MKYIVTYNEQERDLCFNELKRLEKGFEVVQNLNEFQSVSKLDLSKY